MAVTFASFQMLGKDIVVREQLNKAVTLSAMQLARVFNKMPGMLSGPQDFVTSISLNNFKTPSIENSISLSFNKCAVGKFRVASSNPSSLKKQTQKNYLTCLPFLPMFLL